jgi:hypothetical protein
MLEGAHHPQPTFLTEDDCKAWLNEESQRFLLGYKVDPRRLRSDKGGELNASRD